MPGAGSVRPRTALAVAVTQAVHPRPRRPGGTAGRTNRIRARRPGADLSTSWPFDGSTQPRTVGGPSPDLRPRGLVVKQGSNTVAFICAGIPGPLSVTVKRTACRALSGLVHAEDDLAPQPIRASRALLMSSSSTKLRWRPLPNGPYLRLIGL